MAKKKAPRGLYERKWTKKPKSINLRYEDDLHEDMMDCLEIVRGKPDYVRGERADFIREAMQEKCDKIRKEKSND